MTAPGDPVRPPVAGDLADRPATGGYLRKTLWFVGLWAAGVLTVGIGAEALKWLIFGHTH